MNEKNSNTIKWTYCPECGSEKIRYAEGTHKQCADCKQEWFSDVDYSNNVKMYLSRLHELTNSSAKLPIGNLDSLVKFEKSGAVSFDTKNFLKTPRGKELMQQARSLAETFPKTSVSKSDELPKYEDQHIWMLMYADQDMQPPTLLMGPTADAQAKEIFERASQQWTCRLFQCVAQSGYGPSPIK